MIMKNIINYAQDNTNSFDQDKLNELDSAILCLLAYCNFEKYPNFKVLKDISVDNDDILFDLTHKSLGENSLRELLKVICNNPRFKNIKIIKPVNKVEIKTQLQFCAVTFDLGRQEYYLSFRGTSATTVGWKENFNMSFKKEVPSQFFAKKYFHDIKKKFPGKYFLGGHSKGGNLAFYVGLAVSQNELANIVRIDCFDGPGFYDQQARFDKNILANLDLFHKFIPDNSIVGLLQDDLINNEQYCKIIKADAIAPLQHNVFTWQIDNDKFLLSKLVSPSEISWQAIEIWLSGLDDNDRQDFVEMMYSIINYSDDIYLNQIFNPKNTFTIANRLYQAQNTNSDLWKKVLSQFANAYIQSSKNYFSQKQKALIASMQVFIKDRSIQQRAGILDNILKGSKIKSDK